MALAMITGALLVFMRFSLLPEIQATVTGFNLYLLYLVGIPACVAVLISGGLGRTLGGGPATLCWIGYIVWMSLAVPFSSWRGGAVETFSAYTKNVPLLFVTAGLVINWKMCKWMFYAIAWGAAVNLLAARIFFRDYGGRTGIELQSIGNPNDFAGHLLLVLPFLLWIGLGRRPLLIRMAAFAGILFGTYLIVGTASRGALVALGCDVLFMLWKGTSKQRLVLLVLIPILVIGGLVVTPSGTLERLSSFSTSSAGRSAESEEAVESSESRKYLLKKSIEYSFDFPLFGVGPGQFANYEGQHETVIGTHGSYHGTHNTYTQAAVECGIPAFLFFVGGMIFCFRVVNGIFKEARLRPECKDIEIVAYCFLLGMVGFSVAITFLNFAYMFYPLAMSGLAVGMRRSATEEFRLRKPQSLVSAA